MLPTRELTVFSLMKSVSAMAAFGRPSAMRRSISILLAQPTYIGLAILAAVVSTVITALLPARMAARLNPLDVMR